MFPPLLTGSHIASSKTSFLCLLIRENVREDDSPIPRSCWFLLFMFSSTHIGNHISAKPMPKHCGSFWLTYHIGSLRLDTSWFSTLHSRLNDDSDTSHNQYHCCLFYCSLSCFFSWHNAVSAYLMRSSRRCPRWQIIMQHTYFRELENCNQYDASRYKRENSIPCKQKRAHRITDYLKRVLTVSLAALSENWALVLPQVKS